MKEQITDAEIFLLIKNWFKSKDMAFFVTVLLALNTLILFVVGVLSIFIGTEFIKNPIALVVMGIFTFFGLFTWAVSNIE